MSMMLHRHFETREEEKAQPAPVPEKDRKIQPATDVPEGEDILKTGAEQSGKKKTARKR